MISNKHLRIFLFMKIICKCFPVLSCGDTNHQGTTIVVLWFCISNHQLQMQNSPLHSKTAVLAQESSTNVGKLRCRMATGYVGLFENIPSLQNLMEFVGATFALRYTCASVARYTPRHLTKPRDRFIKIRNHCDHTKVLFLMNRYLNVIPLGTKAQMYDYSQ